MYEEDDIAELLLSAQPGTSVMNPDGQYATECKVDNDDIAELLGTATR